MTALYNVPPPADALAAVRADIKRLKKTEDALRDFLLGDREARVGLNFHAVVSDRQRSTVDWQGLARSLGATEQTIAAYTTTSEYQHVDVESLPSIPALIAALEDELIVVNCETTGLSPVSDRLISLGALPRMPEDGWVWGNSAAWTVNPGMPSHPRALAVHGLTDEFLSKLEPLTAETAAEIDGYLDVTLVAHDAPFDVGFINAELGRHGLTALNNPVVDTRIVSKILWPGEKASLDAMAARLGVDVSERAEGIHDSPATAASSRAACPRS